MPCCSTATLEMVLGILPPCLLLIYFSLQLLLAKILRPEDGLSPQGQRHLFFFFFFKFRLLVYLTIHLPQNVKTLISLLPSQFRVPVTTCKIHFRHSSPDRSFCLLLSRSLSLSALMAILSLSGLGRTRPYPDWAQG